MNLVTRLLFALSISLFATLTMAAQPVLLPAWQATPFEQPESVIYDQKNDVLYVSNVNG
ncbi:MAG: gluconolaconase, partial [Gammaproteobacteria bacterium]